MARQRTEQFGAELWKEGYRGYFELDYLWDMDSGELFLGELNPRISGACSLTNQSVGMQATLPLFAFHLLEWLNVPFDLNVDELNDFLAEPNPEDDWSQLMLYHTDKIGILVKRMPVTGLYRLLPTGKAALIKRCTDRTLVNGYARC